jgi:hypothetical protein
MQQLRANCSGIFCRDALAPLLVVGSVVVKNFATLIALAERCVAATGKEDPSWFNDMARAIHEVDPRSPVNGSCRDYVRSIDAALRLRPEGMEEKVAGAVAI